MGVSIGELCWRALLEISMGVSIGELCWRALLEISIRELYWGSLLGTSTGRLSWRDKSRPGVPPYGAVCGSSWLCLCWCCSALGGKCQKIPAGMKRQISQHH